MEEMLITNISSFPTIFFTLSITTIFFTLSITNNNYSTLPRSNYLSQIILYFFHLECFRIGRKLNSLKEREDSLKSTFLILHTLQTNEHRLHCSCWLLDLFPAKVKMLKNSLQDFLLIYQIVQKQFKELNP